MPKFFKNVGANVDENLNEIERKIISLVLNDPTLTAENISGHIERIGTDKKENWKVIK